MTRTRVRVIGASPLVMRRLRAMAPARVDVVDERQRLHGGFEGWLQIARVVPLLWVPGLLGRLPGVRQLGHAVYRIIAANRVRRGRCTDDVCAPTLTPGNSK